MIKCEQVGLDKDYLKSLVEEAKKEKFFKNQWKLRLKGLINISGLFKWLDENGYWTPLEIVEIYNTDEKNSGYQSYQHVRVKDNYDKKLYMKQNESEIRGIDNYCVWQTVGMMGDDYSGYLLFPLKDGKYFKVSYSC